MYLNFLSQCKNHYSTVIGRFQVHTAFDPTFLRLKPGSVLLNAPGHKESLPSSRKQDQQRIGAVKGKNLKIKLLELMI